MNAALESPPAATGGMASAWTPPHPSLALTFCGLRFASPLVLLAGCVGFGEEYTRVAGFSNRDVGALCLAGTTAQPRAGFAPHRIAETATGILSATGWQNPGVASVVRDLLPLLDFTETRFIANVCGNTLEEQVEVAARFADSPIDALELNLSAPDADGAMVSFAPEWAARVVAACRRVTSKPLIAKLGADQRDIRVDARACIEAGADALAVIHAVPGSALHVRRQLPVLGAGHGVLSGPAIKPIALLKLSQVVEVARPLGIPVIGQGGITTAQDAIEFLLAGATAIGLGTALFYDPLVCPKINRGIADYLAAQGHASLAALAA
jgi:dihydroorotate dehydrogenase (NAD+) catalytic subunit